MNFINRIKLCWIILASGQSFILNLCQRILTFDESNILEHAETELAMLVNDDDNVDGDIQRHMNQCLKELVLVFATQGHSGFSASYARGTLDKLLDFQSLTPLTGEDSEWCEIDEGRWQNKRCPRVFKDLELGAYDIEGKVFQDRNGSWYTSKESRVLITFPYTPQTEFVKYEN